MTMTMYERKMTLMIICFSVPRLCILSLQLLILCALVYGRPFGIDRLSLHPIVHEPSADGYQQLFSFETYYNSRSSN
jgi:hypothetical protein